jgi:hypothetical protein
MTTPVTPAIFPPMPQLYQEAAPDDEKSGGRIASALTRRLANVHKSLSATAL